MGMVKLMDEAESGAVEGNAYSFAIAAAVDEVTPKIVKGETDIAGCSGESGFRALPEYEGRGSGAGGQYARRDYIVESGDSVKSVEDPCAAGRFMPAARARRRNTRSTTSFLKTASTRRRT